MTAGGGTREGQRSGRCILGVVFRESKQCCVLRCTLRWGTLEGFLPLEQGPGKSVVARRIEFDSLCARLFFTSLARIFLLFCVIGFLLVSRLREGVKYTLTKQRASLPPLGASSTRNRRTTLFDAQFLFRPSLSHNIAFLPRNVKRKT